MIEPCADRPTAIALGADKAYDAEDIVNELRSMNATPHVAQNTSGRSSAIDGRTTRHGGFAASQRIEEAFGWIKTVAGQENTSFRGRDRVAVASYLRCRRPQSGAAAQADSGGWLMAKVPGFAKAFAGRWRIAEWKSAEFSWKRHDENYPIIPHAVADQASFAHAAKFFNSLLEGDYGGRARRIECCAPDRHDHGEAWLRRRHSKCSATSNGANGGRRTTVPI
jgi:hypothetical protein